MKHRRAFYLLLICCFSLSSCVLKKEHDATLASISKIKKQAATKEEQISGLKEENKKLQEQNQELSLRNQDLSHTNQLLVQKNKEFAALSIESQKSLLEKKHTVEKKKSANKSLERLAGELGAATKETKGVSTVFNADAQIITLTLPHGFTFKSRKMELTEGAQKLLSDIAGPLKSQARSLTKVVGHSDNVELNGRAKRLYGSNWELSAMRAGTVLRYLESVGVSSQSLELKAMGPSLPVASNQSSEGRAKNRRIELKISLKNKGL